LIKELKVTRSRMISKEKATSKRTLLACSIIIVNTFAWYSCGFVILKEILSEYLEEFLFWSINFVGAALSILIGASIANNLRRRILVAFWLVLGIFSSLIPNLLNQYTAINILIIFLLFGISFGLGIPVCMAYFTECTTIENRARHGGAILFFIGLGTLFLSSLRFDIMLSTLVLAAWRGSSLLFLPWIRVNKDIDKKTKKISYMSILNQRSFLLYLGPWIMFCLVNYLSAPIIINFFGEDFVRTSTLIEGGLVGIFAIVGGIFADKVGRKPLIIIGFILLGLGYAILGIRPESLLSWYIYTVIDGIAGGIILTIFIFTLWGDIAFDCCSEKYYAIGGLPYLLSNFLRLIIGQYVIQTVLVYTIFSLVSLFLFLAVVPLMFAPETLPEKKIRERELRQYIEKAKKIKEKFT
jgi:MFS family permease